MSFEKKNPITSLMSDVATGTLREDILNEKVLSAIVEIKVPVERTEEIIRLVWEVEKEIDTVVAIGVGTRCDESGEDHVVAPILERLGYKLERAKTNIGLGRITQSQSRAELCGGGQEMTNTLHRFGDAESFRDDYVVFAIASRGKNDEDSVPKLKKFLEMARRFNPVNLGDARHGGALRPSRSMNPLSHWKRDMDARFRRGDRPASIRPPPRPRCSTIARPPKIS